MSVKKPNQLKITFKSYTQNVINNKTNWTDAVNSITEKRARNFISHNLLNLYFNFMFCK